MYHIQSIWNNLQHIFLIVVGFLFALVRPYQVDFWNNFDIFIFANMALISVLSQFSYQYSKVTGNPEVITGAFVVEIILIGLPLLLAILYLLHKLWVKLFTCTRKKPYFMKLFAGGANVNNTRSDSSDNIILWLIDERSLILDHDSDDTTLHPLQRNVSNSKKGLEDEVHTLSTAYIMDKNGSTNYNGRSNGVMTSGYGSMKDQGTGNRS